MVVEIVDMSQYIFLHSVVYLDKYIRKNGFVELSLSFNFTNRHGNKS